MYKIARSVLFLLGAEAAHHFAMNVLSNLFRIRWLRNLAEASYRPRAHLQTRALGLLFRNPVMLAAGFDKNARYLTVLETLGFGAVEIGTVTPKPQPGNERPRLFRLPKDKALINRMGFNNDGAAAIAERLKTWAQQRPASSTTEGILIGGNIGKNKQTPNADAWQDYALCFRALFDYVDYFVVNVSSPNTPGLRELQEKNALAAILSHLQQINREQHAPKPILLKIAPDLTRSQVDDVVALALEISLDGLIIANTTTDRSGLRTSQKRLQKIGAGGLSGAPLRQKTVDLVRYVSERSHGKLPLIASGGIFTAQHAEMNLAAGATLVQVWTGFIYDGPAIVKQICKGLVQRYTVKL